MAKFESKVYTCESEYINVDTGEVKKPEYPYRIVSKSKRVEHDRYGRTFITHVFEYVQRNTERDQSLFD